MRSLIMTLGCVLLLQYLAGNTQAAAGPDVGATGTGFFINSEGWIVTNAHVLEGCKFATVQTLDGRVDDWRTDKINDLAAFKLDSAANRRHLILSDAMPRLGEDVAAFGFPLSSLLSDSVKVTTGNVNSLGGLHNDTRFLQVSTPIQPGNSGGPVVDRRGLVLGVATATLSLEAALRSGAHPQNVNFAVKASILKVFLESNGITYNADEGQSEVSTVELAELVAPATVQILCNTETTVPNIATAPTTSEMPATPDGPAASKAIDAVGRWAIFRNPETGACAAWRSYQDGTKMTFRVGIEGASLIFANDAWPARAEVLVLAFVNEGRPEGGGEFVPDRSLGEGKLKVEIGAEVISIVARAEILNVSTGGRSLADLCLDGSQRAIAAASACALEVE